MRIPKPVLVLLALGGLGLLVERLIVTDAEAIEALAAEAEDAVNARRYGDLRELLTEGFGFQDRDADETVAYVERLARRFRVEGVSFRLSRIEVDKDTARARARIRVQAYGRPGLVETDVRFRRTAVGWRLDGADAPQLAPALPR